MKPFVPFCLLLLANLASAADTLVTVAEANGIELEELTVPRTFDFTGSVMSIERKWWILSDDTGGVPIFLGASPPSGMRQWDIVRVKGEMLVFDDDKTRRFVAREIEVLRHGNPVPLVDATVQEINSGRFDFKFVRIRGVLSSFVKDEVAPDFIWGRLRTSDGNLLLAVNAHALRTHTILNMADAETEIVGLALPVSGLRQSLGRRLHVYDSNDIRILNPPPRDPFAAPPLLESSVTQHRQRIAGDVIAVSQSCFFLRTGIGRIVKVVPASSEPMPRVGDTVIVAGFPEYVPYWLCLSEAMVKISGTSKIPVENPQIVAISDLFTDSEGRRCLRALMTGHRLMLHGKVVSATENELELSDGENSLFVMLDAVRGQLPEVPKIGSVVEATGLCWSEFHNTYESEIYPMFLRFTLYPQNASDIRVITYPPWWTPFRLTLLALVLVALLAVSFVWSFAVNRKAERRGRELYEERASHAIAEKKVEERTRLAVELHDSISQTLTGIAMQLEVGNNETAKTMLTSCRSDLRRCLWDLRSRTFEEKDMTEAIVRTLEPHSVGAKISVRFNVPRERLSDSTMHAILHVIRELVVNAMRHGKATEIKIAGECHGDAISFSVRDNGCGFDPAAAPGPKDGHFGLLGIRERLREFGGELTIESRPGQGTKATVSLALNTHEGLRTSAPRHRSPGAEVRSQKTASLS